MAFDMTTSPEVQKTPEMKPVPETQETVVEVAQPEQAPVAQYAQPVEQQLPQVEIEAPRSVQPQTYQMSADPLYSKVEGILADEAIGKLYAELPEAKKKTFRAQGEKLAHDITDSIRRRKFKPYKALEGTRKWLGVIDAKFPYLLQKAKNELDELQKTDEAVGRGEEI